MFLNLQYMNQLHKQTKNNKKVATYLSSNLADPVSRDSAERVL